MIDYTGIDYTGHDPWEEYQRDYDDIDMSTDPDYPFKW